MMEKGSILTFLLGLAIANCLPHSNYQEWLVRGDRQPYEAHLQAYRTKRQTLDSPGINVRSFHVDSRIAVRFAAVTITCRVYNGASSPNPYTYELILPPDAFISNFTLIVDDEVYQGVSRDQCEREDPFNFAASGSVSFGSIRSSELSRNLFLIGLNLAPRSQATFIVEYQENLSRSAGWYTQVISVRPGQTVQDFQIVANVVEPQGIERIETAIDTSSSTSTSDAAKYVGYAALPATFTRGSNQYVILNNELQRISRISANFNFQPSTLDQSTYPGNKGIFGDFILRYDVVHNFDIGYLQVVGNVFVHYFSPTGPLPIKKNVVFVIDISGSMYGLKLRQTKEALTTILDEVRLTDLFNVIRFSDDVGYWTPNAMVEASPQNIEGAKLFVGGLQPRRGTNLNRAVLSGLNLLEITGAMESQSESAPSICIVFLLTDGKPTGEVSSVRQIEANAREKNRGRCSIVTLGFGSDVDFNFLARLALQNRGVARKISTGSSAAKQLKGVYDEVATPLLSDISVEYLGNVVDPETVSATNFSTYFNGSEIAIAGRLVEFSANSIRVRIVANGSEGVIELEEVVDTRRKPPRSLRSETVPDNFAERTWAFLTLGELFKRFTLADDADERRVLVERSVEISEHYNLLTPLTSMVLVDSNGSPISASQTSVNGENFGASSSVSQAPNGFQWGILGLTYGVRGDVDSTYGIGSAECSERSSPTPPPPEESLIDLHSMHITSKITERYARTDVSAVMTNRGTQAEAVVFSYQIPNRAFVSDFSVTLNGVEYRGIVQDRREGRWRAAFARSEAGNTVLLQTRRDPSKSMFLMRIPVVEPESPVNFRLTYDQLLKRIRGKYHHVVSIWPDEVIEDFSVNVHITEPQGIEDISTKYHQRGFVAFTDLDTSISRSSNTRAQITYRPTEDEQLAAGDDGIEGDLIFEYDVEHDRDGSHTQVQNGYFVHFFSPSDLQQASKHIVFVVDVSASMYGTKLRQIKDGLKLILDDLGPNDHFNLIIFSDNVRYWRVGRLAPATLRNVREAKAYLESLTDEDETNLNAAILAADDLLDTAAAHLPDGENVLSLMIVLTDGKPSQGVVDTENILQNARAAINGEHALYSLGFGQDVEFDLLVQLALQNNGFARKIYETLAVSKELKDLYYEVSGALLFDIMINYEDGNLDPQSMTRQNFPVYFDGSELIVAGRVEIGNTAARMPGTVEAKSGSGDFYKSTNTDLTGAHRDLRKLTAVDNVVEKIWSLLTLQALIDEYSVTQDPHRSRVIADEVVRIGGEYNLLTPLTPLSLYDPVSGALVQGSSQDPVPLPAFSQAEGSVGRLKTAIDLSPGVPTDPDPRPGQPKDAPLAVDSSSGIYIDRLHAISLIALRYATTRVEQDLVNEGSRKGQAVFKQKIPLDAFITNITIEINGVNYNGHTDSLDDTLTFNLGSLETGRSGGIVTPLDHESKLVVVSVPLNADQTAKFTVTYQKLLPRRRGTYLHKVFLFPEQIVDDILVDTVIVEPQGLASASAFHDDRKLDTPRDLSYLIEKRTNSRWSIQHRPTQRQQAAVSPRGLAGEFIVKYDVVHTPDAGNIQILNDYFVHHFSPSGLSVLSKNVVFVIDISDSMAGTKLQQVKDALKTIFDDMRPTDKFNILPFHSRVEFLDRFKMLEASQRNIRSAKEFVDNLQPQEATNLNRAILEGVNQLRREGENSRDGEKVVSMLIVLTDGEPTYGETDEAQIERNVREAINRDYSLFALGFGDDVDFPFLNRLALQNHGVARKIPARADASQLLEGFYEEVATPLLYDIEFRYSGGIEPQSLSDISFANYFNGSELVVVGKLIENIPMGELEAYVYGQTATENLRLTSTGDADIPSLELVNPEVPRDLLSKLWAYHIIQTLIQTKEEREGNAVFTAELDRDIIELSLQHKFFNPHTAFIVKDPTSGESEPASQPLAMRIVEGALPRYTLDDLVQRLSVRVPQPFEEFNTPGGGGTVDNDPHFLVYVPKSDLHVCFDIGYDPGTAINLLQDRKRGLYVNGKIIGATLLKDGENVFRTYIGGIGVMWFYSRHKLPMEIWFTPDNITLSYYHVLPWGRKLSFKYKGLKVAVDGKEAQVTFKHNTTFTVLRHKMPDGNKEHKPNYLGFYLENTKGLSDGLHGLIGQFQNTRIDVEPLENEAGKTAQLKLKRRSVHVKMGSRTNNLKNIKKDCWKADNNGAGLIDGHYTDYIMSSVFGTE